jgi:hypothetical protein
MRHFITDDTGFFVNLLLYPMLVISLVRHLLLLKHMILIEINFSNIRITLK